MEQDNSNDIEKLLKIVEASNEPVRYKYTEVDKYIEKFNIADGDTKVPTYIIYFHYWKNLTNKRKKMTRRAFFNQFKKKFTNVQTNDGKGYLLDPEPFDLTREGYFRARALLRRERNGRKKEKSKQ